MTEGQKEWLSWAVLLFFVFLAGYIADDLAGLALGAVVDLLLSLAGALRLGGLFAALVVWPLRDGVLAAQFFVLGFAYCYLIEKRWKKAGLAAWLLFMFFREYPLVRAYGRPALKIMATAGWFYADLAFAGAASFFGAWQADRHGDNETLGHVRDLVFSTLFLN